MSSSSAADQTSSHRRLVSPGTLPIPAGMSLAPRPPTPDPRPPHRSSSRDRPCPLDTRRVRSASPPRRVGPAARRLRRDRASGVEAPCRATRPGAICAVCTPAALLARSRLGGRDESNRASAPDGCSHRDASHTTAAQRGHPTYRVCETLVEVETACVDCYASVEM